MRPLNEELAGRLNLHRTPRFTHDGNDMLALIEAMLKRGFDLHIDLQSMEMGGAWVEWMHVDRQEVTRLDLDNFLLTETVAKCALQALKALEVTP